MRSIASNVIPPDKHQFVIDELKKAKFYKSNRQGFGPTPESSIVIYFNNGTELRLNYWESGIFEHSRTVNGETSQFLILNERLGDWHKTFIDWPPPIPRGDWPGTAIYYYGTDYHPTSAIAVIDSRDLGRIGEVRVNNQIVPVFVRKSDSGMPKRLYVHFSDFDKDSYKVYMR
ncbi:MAG TPA: hypothetical protein VE439_03560 [Anaerolineae bacterium]|nr:hypothetical protein [Anaerolineae bacterium]